MEKEQCDKCCYFKEIYRYGTKHCCVRFPIEVPKFGTDWCGEFKLKEDEDVQRI